MSNITYFKKPQHVLRSNAQYALAIMNALDPDVKDTGLGVIVDIDHRIKPLQDLSDAELNSASIVASAFYGCCNAEAEAAGETPAAIASVVEAVLSDDNPRTIRDLTRRAQRQIADAPYETLSSRERRLVVAAWARRQHEFSNEQQRRKSANE